MFGFGGGTSIPAPPAANQGPANQGQPQQNSGAVASTIPSFDEEFPNRSISQKIGQLLRYSTCTNDIDDTTIAGQELKAVLSVQGPVRQRLLHIDQDPTLQPAQPDLGLRQRLSQYPTVLLSIPQHDGTVEYREATLTPTILRDVCSIADDLQISEPCAICLYQQAASRNKPFHSSLVKNCLEETNITREDSIAWSAREIFFAQRILLLQTCRALVQHRLGEPDFDNNHVCRATDELLQNGWILRIIQLVRIYSQRINTISSSHNNTKKN